MPRPLRSRALLIALGAAVVALAGLAGAVLVQRAGPAVAVRIEPGAILLTAPGQTRTLMPRLTDGQGKAATGEVVWTSSHPDVVAVDPAGTALAKAPGSSQIVAEVAGIRSEPILALVSTPADGVALVDDSQVVSPPAAVDPAAAPSWQNPYRVSLRGVTPAVGDRLLGTGGQPIAGEVVEVAAVGDATAVTLRLVPLAELLPDLVIDEVIDLSAAPVVVPDDVLAQYDVARAGRTITFTPNARFIADVQAALGTETSRGGWPSTGLQLAGAGGAESVLQLLSPADSGELDLFGFTCKASIPDLPIQLAVPPALAFELNPAVDIDWTDGGLRRFVVSGQVKATVDGRLKVTAAFGGKVSCERELYKIWIPINGPASLFVGGVVPVGGAIELAGNVTVSTMEIGTKVEAQATAELGLECPNGTCSFARNVTGTTTFEPKIDGPSLADLRFEPSLEASGTMKLAIGSPLLSSLRLDLLQAKAGGKLGASYAQDVAQILDPAYKSEFKLTFEAGASLAADNLPELAQLLGVGSITLAELKTSIDLARSPLGTLETDKAAYASGEPIVATVTLDPEHLEFLEIYDVVRVRLVRYAAGALQELGAAEPAAGQATFTITAAAPATTTASELHAFVTTNVPPIDAFALELDRRTPGPGIVFTTNRDNPTAVEDMDIWVANEDGTNPRSLAASSEYEQWPTWSPDGTKIAYSRFGAIWVMNGDGSGQHQIQTLTADGPVQLAWSPDGTRIAFLDLADEPFESGFLFTMNADGSGRRRLTQDVSGTWPTWSPDSSHIAFIGSSTTRSGLWVVPASGGSPTLLVEGATGAAWSPDGRWIAFLDPRREIWITSPTGDGTQGTGWFGGTRLAWSPDSTRIVYDSPQADGSDLFVLTIEGRTVVPFATEPGFDWMADW